MAASSLVQLSRREERAVALVDGPLLRLVKGYNSVYELALDAIDERRSLAETAQRAAFEGSIVYERVYSSDSEWRLLPPFDHPENLARVMVSGTGLTHNVSAENRAAMHRSATQPLTDSMRMYQLGKNGGRPTGGTAGVQPEWFYKGDGMMLRAHGEELWVPSYGSDGGEEAEIAGAYLISNEGHPYRIGFMAGNEFSDHVMEKQNYLYLAHSKLRACSLGPEMVIGGEELFHDVTGKVTIKRNGGTIWESEIYSGERNMCHSLANLEHHHFKYEAHRRPGDVHIHFFGADAFSFGERISLRDGDWVEISFPAFGRPLKNQIRVVPQHSNLIRARCIN